MSSTVAGDAEAVFSTVGTAFNAAAKNNQVVVVMKVSNACPSSSVGAVAESRE
jgi:hypothetical protein